MFALSEVKEDAKPGPYRQDVARDVKCSADTLEFRVFIVR